MDQTSVAETSNNEPQSAFPRPQAMSIGAASAVSESVFEVEALLDRRVMGGRFHYLILWKGFSLHEATWEPEDNLPQQLKLEFDRARDSRASTASPKATSSASPVHTTLRTPSAQPSPTLARKSVGYPSKSRSSPHVGLQSPSSPRVDHQMIGPTPPPTPSSTPPREPPQSRRKSRAPVLCRLNLTRRDLTSCCCCFICSTDNHTKWHPTAHSCTS